MWRPWVWFGGLLAWFFLFCVRSRRKKTPKFGRATFRFRGVGAVWRAWTCAYRCLKMCVRVLPVSRLGGYFAQGRTQEHQKHPKGHGQGMAAPCQDRFRHAFSRCAKCAIMAPHKHGWAACMDQNASLSAPGWPGGPWRGVGLPLVV